MGAGSTSGASASQIEERYGISADKLYHLDGKNYYRLERTEFKLSSAVLTSFEKNNNFSREVEDTPMPPKNAIIS